MKFKNFLSKWKRQNKLFKIFYILVSLAYVISSIFFIKSLYVLTGIETGIRVGIISIVVLHNLVLTLGGILLMFTNKKRMFIALLIISAIYVPIMSIISYHIDKTYNIIDNVQKKYIDYTSVMVSLKDTASYQRIGMIDAKDDPTGYIIPKKMIEENKIKGKIIEYSDYIAMMSALYNKEIDALFIKDSYITMYDTYETFSHIADETKVVYTKTMRLENTDNVSYSTKKLTEPFTLLLMGVDSTGDDIRSGSSFNGDSLMLITFNPKTLNATIFSIPRDTYVPIACNSNRENKINSSAYGGTTCVVNTIENLTGLKIDYYVKINFTGVVKIVDDLGGVSLDIPINFCEQDSNRRKGEYEICLKKGYQTINGEQALAFARHRHTLPLGDFQRVQHQQMVVEAMVSEIKNINSTKEFYKILDDIANNIDTNMSTEQVLSLYDVAKNVLLNTANKDVKLNIQKTYLTGHDLTMYMPSYSSYVYTFQYNRSSLEAIVDAMKVNLEIKKPTPIKTFSFDANVEYTKEIIGKNTSSDKKRELLPNFVNSTRSYAEAWFKERGINATFTEEASSSVADGVIIRQSVHEGQTIDTITSIELIVAKNSSSSVPSTHSNNPSGEGNTDKDRIPDFVGKNLADFQNWKNNLKNASIILDASPLSVEDAIILSTGDLIENRIYKQSVPAGSKIDDTSSFKVFYYKSSN